MHEIHSEKVSSAQALQLGDLQRSWKYDVMWKTIVGDMAQTQLSN